MKRVALAANCCTTLPRSLFLPLHICLLPFFPPFAFWFKHGRVNLLILQAASPSICLSSCFPPLSLSPSLRQGCAVRLFQSSGVVRSDGWLSTFCCLPLRSWEIYRLADYQAWKPISLPHSSLPPSMPASRLPSYSLYFNISSVTKKAFIMERCVRNSFEICVWTQGSNWCTGGILWMCQRGVSSSEWLNMSLTAYLAHLHLLHRFKLPHRRPTHGVPFMFFLLVVIRALKKGAKLINVWK